MVVFYFTDEHANRASIYKRYQIREGELVSLPAPPTADFGSFAGWMDGNGNMADFSKPVTQDISYFALWE